MIITLNKLYIWQAPLEPDTVKLETPADYDATTEGAEEAYLKNHVISILRFVGTIYQYTIMHL